MELERSDGDFLSCISCWFQCYPCSHHSFAPSSVALCCLNSKCLHDEPGGVSMELMPYQGALYKDVGMHSCTERAAAAFALPMHSVNRRLVFFDCSVRPDRRISVTDFLRSVFVCCSYL